MKKIFLAAALFFGCLGFQQADAQIHISLGLNIGSQPDWGPVGYDHAEYYYLPDIDAYYYVPNHQFVYYQGNQWIHAGSLPPQYANYDLYNGYKVVVNEANPWQRASYYRSHYSSYRGRHGQGLIRDSHDSRYQNHWQGGGYGNHGNGYGHGNYGHGQGYQNNGGNGRMQGGYHGNNGNYGRGGNQSNVPQQQNNQQQGRPQPGNSPQGNYQRGNNGGNPGNYGGGNHGGDNHGGDHGHRPGGQ